MAAGNAQFASSRNESVEPSGQSIDHGERSPEADTTHHSGSKHAPTPRRGNWLLIAAVTCPCHLPIYVALLSGTVAGSLLSENLVVGAAVLGLVFLGSVVTYFPTR